MDKKRKDIDNFLRMQARLNKKSQLSPKTKIVKTEPRKIDYINVHKRFQIICNNSVNGGDCYGETMCVCKCFLYDTNFHKYYSTEPRKEDLHHDFRCKKCMFHICGCCYSVCPSCGNSEDIDILPH